MQKLKLNDEVKVISGQDKGKTGSIVKIDLKKNLVTVKGVNLKKKAIRPSQEAPNGGHLEIERPLAWSKVSLVSPKTSKPSRVKISTNKEGKKVRVLVKCGTVLK
jgi:large subunit ribosomal protein L24